MRNVFGIDLVKVALFGLIVALPTVPAALLMGSWLAGLAVGTAVAVMVTNQ